MRWITALSAIAASLILLAACERSTTERPAPERPTKILAHAIFSDPKTFNPVLITDDTSRRALAPVFEGLVRIDPQTTRPIPALAETWQAMDEGRVWVFELRQDVVWHDGHPFTSADVVFTFETIFDDAVPNSARYSLTVGGEPIRVETDGPHRVRFQMKEAFAPFLYAMDVWILPAHLLRASLDQGEFTRQWGIDTPPEDIIGTGPYRMTRYVPSQVMEFRRNENYWERTRGGDPLPFLSARATLIVPEQNTIALRFLAGQTHYYEPRPEEIPNLEDRADELGIHVREIGIDTGNQFVVFNRNPSHWNQRGKEGQPDPKLRWFSDRNFLRALAHAVDKPGMVNTVYYGFGSPSVANISPANHIFHNPGLEDYQYDLDLSRSILEASGYIDRDGDGIREDRAGNPIVFGLTTNAGNTLRERICSILLQDWQSLGLEIHYRPQTFQSLVERLNVTYDWDVVMIGFTGSLDPNNGANFLRSSGNLHVWNPVQKEPATPWEAEIDQLLDQGAAELDLEKRRRFYWQIQTILHRELPFIGLVRQRKAFAWSRNLENFHPLVWGLWKPNQIDIAP
jgi:peptide/nickel transport system substrate-binding protein